MNIQSASGELTSYGLACGYIQQTSDSKTRVELYREHNTFHVQLVINGKSVIFESFGSDKLTEARRKYRKLVNEVRKI